VDFLQGSPDLRLDSATVRPFWELSLRPEFNGNRRIIASSAFVRGAPNLTGNWTLHPNVAGNESDHSCKSTMS
jgi:hypothetical protein